MRSVFYFEPNLKSLVRSVMFFSLSVSCGRSCSCGGGTGAGCGAGGVC